MTPYCISMIAGYSQTGELEPIVERDVGAFHPRVLDAGSDITIVGPGYSTLLSRRARDVLAQHGVSAEVVDLRVLNPFEPDAVLESVQKTRRLLVVDGGWRTCGMSAEVIASCVESLSCGTFFCLPGPTTLPDAPAPTSRALEKIYYPDVDSIVARCLRLLSG